MIPYRRLKPATLTSNRETDLVWKKRFDAWWNTAQATEIYREGAMNNLFSRDSMLKEFDMANGCSYYPFEGVWAEANASTFSWQTPGPNEIYKFSFKAQNYHYLPQNGTEALQLMPARSCASSA